MAVVWNYFPKMHFQASLPQGERLFQKIRRCLQRIERKNAFSDNQKVNFEMEGDTGFVLMYVSKLHFKRKIEFSDTNLRTENLADISTEAFS